MYHVSAQGIDECMIKLTYIIIIITCWVWQSVALIGWWFWLVSLQLPALIGWWFWLVSLQLPVSSASDYEQGDLFYSMGLLETFFSHIKQVFKLSVCVCASADACMCVHACVCVCVSWCVCVCTCGCACMCHCVCVTWCVCFVVRVCVHVWCLCVCACVT